MFPISWLKPHMLHYEILNEMEYIWEVTLEEPTFDNNCNCNLCVLPPKKRQRCNESTTKETMCEKEKERKQKEETYKLNKKNYQSNFYKSKSIQLLTSNIGDIICMYYIV